jgi:hypothetical protein
MYACMYAYMYVCICMYAYMYVCMYVWGRRQERAHVEPQRLVQQDKHNQEINHNTQDEVESQAVAKYFFFALFVKFVYTLSSK